MSERTFALETRQDSGLGHLRALRKAGKIPAILYGHGSAPKKVSIDARALGEILQHDESHSLLALTIDGHAGETALLKELQRDPITRKVIHADLQLVSATEEIRAHVQVVAVGIAPGVKDSGGVLDLITHTLEIAAPANAVPEHLEVDVSYLNLHDHVTAGQIPLPPGARMITAGETMVLTIEAPRKAEEETVVAATEAVPEVIGKPAADAAKP